MGMTNSGSALEMKGIHSKVLELARFVFCSNRT